MQRSILPIFDGVTRSEIVSSRRNAVHWSNSRTST